MNVSEVSLNKTSITITEGGTETLTATVLPTGATEKRVNWSSSDASVVSVDGNETTIPVSVSSWSFNYLFSYFDYEGGDGSKYEYLAGVPDGAKLYYVKIWNGDDLVYFGHASRSVCSFSSEEEYCWYEEVGNKYTFARNLHTLASSEIIPYQTISPVVSVRQPFGGGID